MSAAPDGKTPSDPSNDGEKQERLPEKPELPRCIVRWFRGFHLHREKPKITDCLTAALTLGVAIAAFWSAWIFQGQFTLMRDADRPWIDVNVSITSPVTYDGNVVQAGFTIVPTNIGRSPAQNISINPNLTPAFMFDNLNEIQKRLCEGATTKSGMASLQYVLFPGRHYTQPVAMNVQVKDLDARFGKMPPGQGPPDLIPIALVGCVDYTYESSDRHHQTAFAFDVLMKDQRIPGKSKTPIVPADLILMSHPTAGHYPN